MTASTAPALRLEPMTGEEYDAWRGYAVRGYAQEFVDSGTLDPDAAAERAEKDFDELLSDGLATTDHLLWSGRVDGEDRAVGAIWVKVMPERTPPHAFVFGLDVYPEFRRRGFGRALMEGALDELRHRGIATVGLNVFGHNDVARRMYDQLGFRVTSTQMKLTL